MKDFEIITEAKRTHPTLKGFTKGYIVKYDGDLYFVHTPDDGVTIDDCQFWTLDVEKHWCIEDYDADFYNYYEVDSILRPLVLEVSNDD